MAGHPAPQRLRLVKDIAVCFPASVVHHLDAQPLRAQLPDEFQHARVRLIGGNQHHISVLLRALGGLGR